MAKTNTRTIVRYAPKKKRRYSHKMTIPLAIVAGFVPLGVHAYNDARNWGAWGQNGAMAQAIQNLSGFNPFQNGFTPESLPNGLYPILLGFAAHWGAGRLGINRMLGRAGVPLLRF